MVRAGAVAFTDAPDAVRDAGVLRRALEYGFTEAEIAEQVSEARQSLTRQAEMADTRPTPALAGAIVSTFGAERVFSHPRDGLARAAGLAYDSRERVMRSRPWPSPAPAI